MRIFYGLDRFSEDLDFSLREPDPAFDLSLYLPALEREIRSYGLNFNAVIKEKTADSDIRSAFLKGNTKEHMLMFYGNPQLTRSIGGNELIKIKFEVDTNPPDYATFETRKGSNNFVSALILLCSFAFHCATQIATQAFSSMLFKCR